MVLVVRLAAVSGRAAVVLSGGRSGGGGGRWVLVGVVSPLLARARPPGIWCGLVVLVVPGGGPGWSAHCSRGRCLGPRRCAVAAGVYAGDLSAGGGAAFLGGSSARWGRVRRGGAVGGVSG